MKPTAEQIQAFRTAGYFTIPLLTAEEVAESRRQLTRVCDECDDLGRHPSGCMFLIEQGRDGKDRARREMWIRKYANVAQAIPYFWNQIRDQRFVDAVEGVVGPKAKLLQCMSLVKPPEIGVPKDWHQDSPYFRLDRTDEVVGIWLAYDDATLENGCMQVVPGSHLAGQAPHVQGPTGWKLAEETIAPRRTAVQAIPLPAGSALVFNGNLWHFTDANRSQSRRRAAQYHYVSQRTQAAAGATCQFWELDGDVPPFLREQEMRQAG